MAWDVEYTDELRAWWETLTESQQDDVAAAVQVLMDAGPHLRFPYSSGVAGARYRHLRELRVQSGGRPLRVFYAFDPRRTAILLLGGDKTGDDRFYATMLPDAERLYTQYIDELRQEGHLP